MDVSVWNTQWLLGRLIGVDQSRPSEASLPSIQEVSEDDDGEQPQAQVLSQNIYHHNDVTFTTHLNTERWTPEQRCFDFFNFII